MSTKIWRKFSRQTEKFIVLVEEIEHRIQNIETADATEHTKTNEDMETIKRKYRELYGRELDDHSRYRSLAWKIKSKEHHLKCLVDKSQDYIRKMYELLEEGANNLNISCGDNGLLFFLFKENSEEEKLAMSELHKFKTDKVQYLIDDHNLRFV